MTSSDIDNANMRKCHHCHVEAPEKEIKYWPNGAGLCIPCYKEADEKDEALYKKIMEEISGKNVENAGWG